MKYELPQKWIERISADPHSEFAVKALKAGQVLAARNPIPDHIAQNSSVGTRILLAFKKYIAAVPCSGCKRTLLKLNGMQVSEIRRDHDSLVDEIEKNSKHAKVSFIAKVSLVADQLFTGGGVTRMLISALLKRACDDDEAVKPIDSNDGNTLADYLAGDH